MALSPVNFYGSALPRPRLCSDEDRHRIDPPTSIMDPLLLWAHDTSWSFGGLRVRRVRAAGSINRSIKKVRSEKEKAEKQRKVDFDRSSLKSEEDENSDFEDPIISVPDSPPPAPMAVKRRRRMVISDDGCDDLSRRWPTRKLQTEFDQIAEETGMVARSDLALDITTSTESMRLEIQTSVEEKKVSLNKRMVLMKGQKKI